jgi:hypothetical protein
MVSSGFGSQVGLRAGPEVYRGERKAAGLKPISVRPLSFLHGRDQARLGIGTLPSCVVWGSLRVSDFRFDSELNPVVRVACREAERRHLEAPAGSNRGCLFPAHPYPLAGSDLGRH